MEDSKDDAIVEVELDWQFEQMLFGLGIEEFEGALADSEGFLGLGNLMAVTAEQAELLLVQAEEKILRAALGADDAAVVASIEAGKEARAKHHSETAAILASGAALSAANGISDTKWVAAVLARHPIGSATRIGCVTWLLANWKKGPWPWPREDAG
jgi:hypothetical protein